MKTVIMQKGNRQMNANTEEEIASYKAKGYKEVNIKAKTSRNAANNEASKVDGEGAKADGNEEQ